MEDSARIEKIDNHKYRIYLKWDGTEKMLKGLLEDGFSVFDDKGVYYTDYEDEHIMFNFGMSMCECFNKLINNHLFTADYILHCSHQTPDANLIKEVEEKIPPYNLVKTMVDCLGMEAFLRLIAFNYDSLIEEATDRYQDSDEASFMAWLKKNIKPRFTTQVLPEIYSQYLNVNRIGTNLSGLYCGYWAAWRDVRDNWEDFLDWVNNVELTSEVDFEIFESLINHKDNIKKQFYTVYFYGYEGFANILFGMLNDPKVLFRVKKLIQDVLKGCAKNDSEFAEAIQMMYSRYKSIAGGIDITFETTASTDTAQITPQTCEPGGENVAAIEPKESEPKTKGKSRKPKYERFRLQGNYLERDAVDIDGFEHCDGLRQEIIDKGDGIFQMFIQGVAKKFHYIDDDPITKFSFAYALTGRGFQDNSIIIKVKWHLDASPKKPKDPVRDLLYISKHMFDMKGDRYTQLFKVLNAGTNPYKNSSRYADKGSKKFKEFFKDCFGDLKKKKVANH